jgi:hypothetical protein
MGFLEAILATGFGAVATWLVFRLRGIAVEGTARICQSSHLLIDDPEDPWPDHLDIELRAWSRAGRAVTLPSPELKLGQELQPWYLPKPLRLAQDGAEATDLIVLRPEAGEPLSIQPGDRVTVLFRPSSGGKKVLRLRVRPKAV